MAIFKMDNLHTVLFDENSDSAEVSKLLLVQAGITQSRHMRDIKETVQMCFRLTIDVLFVDMDNKNGSGHQLVRDLRKAALKDNLNTKVIALIGTKEQEVVLKAASCGVDSILIKPISPTAMKERTIKVHQMSVHYLKFDNYYGPDRRIMPDRLPEGEADKRSDSTEI